MNYVNENKTQHQNTAPLLSVRDVRLLFIAQLMADGVKIGKKVKDLLKRHKQREKDIRLHYPENDYF